MPVVLVWCHVLAAVGVLLAVAAAGRWAALRLRQPPVIGEIVVGLAVGPVVVALGGRATLGTLLPGDVREALALLAEGALVLYVVGLARELRLASARPSPRVTAVVAAGALLPAMLTGCLLAVWVFVSGDAGVRGSAPAPAVVLFLAVALSVSAVPVMARILAERGMSTTTAGVLAVTAAIVVDIAAWLVLSAAVGLRTGSGNGLLTAVGAFGGVIVVAVVVRRAMRNVDCTRWPVPAAVILGAAALAAGFSVHAVGLTAVFGAALVGFAVPRQPSWHRVTSTVSGLGRRLLPIFFVNTGLTVLAGQLVSPAWTVMILATLLAFLGKIGGGYAGARMAGEPRPVALRVGIILNTRGLTELIVLQIGHQAGILTTPLFLALLAMAVTTTAATGPLLSLADRLSPIPDHASAGHR